ncbi:hypothetical protein RJ641_006243 [Dillenia turbinata]|uniref:U1-type domain-containing protein n=1 Tax=Dillenia turbinata TaxID=194707 RepID=A0AAN8VE67_9MAGN
MCMSGAVSSGTNGSRVHVMELSEREREKRRIREEIIAMEVMRQELEAEVRREIMIDREFSRMRSEGLSLLDTSIRSSMSSMRRPYGAGLGGRALSDLMLSNAVGLGERALSGLMLPSGVELGQRAESFLALLRNNDRSAIAERTSLLLGEGTSSLLSLSDSQHQRVETESKSALLPKSEPESLPVPISEPGQLMLLIAVAAYAYLVAVAAHAFPELAKPHIPNLATTKRKADTVTVADDDATILANPSKKQKDFHCNLCQVSATCERGLLDHIRGKKHRAKEALMAGPKKNDSCPLADEVDIDPASLLSDSVDLPEEKKQVVKYHFKFWCQLCRVGTNSNKSMTIHKNGKKHTNLLQKNGGGVITVCTLPEDMKEGNAPKQSMDTLETVGENESPREVAVEERDNILSYGEEKIEAGVNERTSVADECN